jgi:hypothetical protein
MFGWLVRGWQRGTSPAAVCRPAVEVLEERAVPAGHGRTVQAGTAPGAVPLPPYAAGAPWPPNAAHTYIDAQSQAALQAMYFNSPSSLAVYTQNFQGVLRQWVASANHAGIASNAALVQYLGKQLASYYPRVEPVLAGIYPGQSDQTYRLLMAMNLADGYFTYGTSYASGGPLRKLLNSSVGDCTEIAVLLATLVRSEGYPAQLISQTYDYFTPLSHFQAGHAAVYAGGLWLDAEINTAFALGVRDLLTISPPQRLPSLLAHDRVFGFYNWYLNPSVRAAQLAQGLDGGILSFYYQFYFAGMGQGHTVIAFLPWNV